MTVYFDASVFLRVLLRDGPVLPGWDEFEAPFTSRLTLIEIRRVVDRLRLSVRVTDEQFGDLSNMAGHLQEGLRTLPLIEEVLDRAGQPMGVVVGTLDAVHLASALVLREEVPDLVFATHDRQQAIGARALGFEVIGVAF
ncbi:MAG: hypothetical protein C0506_11950 [Anaerolinea sp.]|nr:hypothetical protein [Anaerolinea sp.]